MTTTEIFLLLVLYIAMGLFLCYKRNWYNATSTNYYQFPNAVCVLAVAFMPINFLILFVKVFFLSDWEDFD